MYGSHDMRHRFPQVDGGQWDPPVLGHYSMWQSQKMDHNLVYKDPIWMIQKPNTKFSYRTTISLKDTSSNSPFF